MSETKGRLSRRQFLQGTGVLVLNEVTKRLPTLQETSVNSDRVEVLLADLESADGQYEILIAPGQEAYIHLLDGVSGTQSTSQIHIDQLPLTEDSELRVRLYIGNSNPFVEEAENIVFYTFQAQNFLDIEQTTGWGTQPLRGVSLENHLPETEGMTIGISLTQQSISSVGGQTIEAIDAEVFIDGKFISETAQSYEAHHISPTENSFWLIVKNFGTQETILSFRDIQTISPEE